MKSSPNKNAKRKDHSKAALLIANTIRIWWPQEGDRGMTEYERWLNYNDDLHAYLKRCPESERDSVMQQIAFTEAYLIRLKDKQEALNPDVDQIDEDERIRPKFAESR